MNDTQPVDVKILSGDEILDELYIDESMVRSLDGKMISFSRVRDGIDWVLEPTSQSI